MKYRLKKNQESIQIVDGPYAGRKYRKGELYDDVPPGEAYRFEKVKEAKNTGAGEIPVAVKKKSESAAQGTKEDEQ
ncbi:MAG: hypothetical protein JW884_14255 [Deltaproteobacteria bacterium]|nr:hypothetical protein [Deltaproteobacteria bacterium]